MTETPTEQIEQAPVEAAAEASEMDEALPETVHCRHCGQPTEIDVSAEPDWLCLSCERYQDTMTCPTCKQLARISTMPEDMVPEAHAPARRRKAKES